MGTAVETPVESELAALVNNAEEPPCVTCKKPATYRGVLSCDHSFLVCDEHASRSRQIAAVRRVAKCRECERLTFLVHLHPI